MRRLVLDNKALCPGYVIPNPGVVSLTALAHRGENPISSHNLFAKPSVMSPQGSPQASTAASNPTFRVVALIVCALTIARLIGLALSRVDLFFDEAQYWSWSRELAFGYFSKPPMLAWLIAAAGHVCGDSEACVRAPAPLMFLGTSLLAYAIGHTLYDARTGFWAAMLTALGTGSVFSARIISTDVPLLLFWALALFAYVRLLQKVDWGWAIVLGVAIGAGLLAKYAMIYFVAGMLIAAVLERQPRELLKKPELWLALALAVVTISPNIMWNASNDFLTLRWAGNNVVGNTIEPSVIRPLEFLAAQFAVFGPVVFAVAIAVGARIGSKELLPADRILLAFALPPLAVVTVTAVFVNAYANWAAASFVSLAVLAAAILVRRSLFTLLWGSLALGLVAQIVLIGTDAFPTRISIPFLKSPNPYFRTLGWATYGRTVGQLARKLGIPTIAGDTRANVASLLYYWRDQPEQIFSWPTEELPNFELTRGLTSAAPQPVLFVSDCDGVERFEKFYTKVTPLGNFVTDDPARRWFSAFRLEGPRGPIGPLPVCP
jgi:4-amino-4-deoxy-L-arabinose transferase-like glycosyltransferase